MSFQLALTGVSVSFPHRQVLTDVTLSVGAGERVGVVGENGAGKSTLLRLVAGAQLPDRGTVTVLADGGLGHLGQVLDLSPSHTIADAVDAALADLRALERELRAAERAMAGGEQAELARYGDLLAAFQERDGYTADARVAAARNALGIGAFGPRRELGSLSGGELARLALAGVLAANPELLLLDEPTNHLDDAALDWLVARLRAHRGTVLAVSHDRFFLDQVSTAIVEVDADRAALVRYGTGYPGYLAERRAARRRWAAEYAEWRAEIRRLADWRDTTAHRVAPGRAIPDHNKMKYNGDGRRVQAAITTRVRQAQEKLRRLQAHPVARPPDELRLRAEVAGGRPGILIEASNVRVPGRLELPELTVSAGDRLLVTGPNGAGKSTLLGVLAGAVRAAGTVVRQGTIGYLPQEVAANPSKVRLLTAFGNGLPGDLDEHAERLLALGLFRRSDLDTPVAALSVGQRRRLALARPLVRAHDLVLLDEPTNHFSPWLVEHCRRRSSRSPARSSLSRTTECCGIPCAPGACGWTAAGCAANA